MREPHEVKMVMVRGARPPSATASISLATSSSSCLSESPKRPAITTHKIPYQPGFRCSGLGTMPRFM